MALFTYDNLWAFLSLIGFSLGIVLLAVLQHRFKVGFTWRVLIALALGILFGVILQLIFGAGTKCEAGILIKEWIAIVGQGFVQALQFLVVPLVLVSIIKSIIQFADPKQGAKTAGKLIAFLLATTFCCCIITIVIIRIFHLNADKLVNPGPAPAKPIDIAQTFLGSIPSNLFLALSQTSILPIVFIATILGFANLAIKQKNPGASMVFERGVEIARVFIMELVRIVITFTPYGVLGTMTICAANGDVDSAKQLATIIGGAFTAMALFFILHMIIVTLMKVNPIIYIRQAASTLIFAFSSRSSSACLPLTIRTMQNLGISESTANLAGTLGTCIGQNACAGMQPALLAVLAALSQKREVWSDYSFLIEVVLFVVVASIGTAGVGGGAINVSMTVLGMLGLPLELVGVLVGIDPILDMGRTLINVNDSIVAGVFVSRIEKTIDDEILNGRKPPVEEQNAQPLLAEASGADTQGPTTYTEGSPGGACCLISYE
jgi:L-cystine uptake protein TcyP (sodium:dicarboxylate symporter family)